MTQEEQERNVPERELEDLEVDDEAAEDVLGGRPPAPPGGEPIPYPNRN